MNFGIITVTETDWNQQNGSMTSIETYWNWMVALQLCLKVTSQAQCNKLFLAEMDGQIDLRIIPKFDRTGDGVKWLEKLELVCDLLGVKWLDCVIPLHLTRGAFGVYQQLNKNKKSDAAQIKGALMTAFATDKFIEYEQFETHMLHPGETTDVYLAELQELLVFSEEYQTVQWCACSCGGFLVLSQDGWYVFQGAIDMNTGNHKRWNCCEWTSHCCSTAYPDYSIIPVMLL